MQGLVLAHACRLCELVHRDKLEAHRRYIGEKNIEAQIWYAPLPKRCRCRWFITLHQADDLVGNGEALWVLKTENGALVQDETQIYMPRRVRVPRVDLISRADIERAYIGSENKCRHHVYNPIKKKFVVKQTIPENMTKQQWLEDAEKEIQHERRIRKQYRVYIEECHKVTMDERAKLIRPFQPDPFEGRTIFAFGPELAQRNRT